MASPPSQSGAGTSYNSRNMQKNNDTYAITIYSSPLFFPLWFVVHTHIVVARNGVTSRFEVLGRTPLARREKLLHGYLYKNVLPPEAGLYVICATSATSGIGPRWKTKKCSAVTGGENSVAHRIYEFFETDGVNKCPYIENYNMVRGPNSNTFTQWVTNQFPEAQLKLPINAWGKAYRK